MIEGPRISTKTDLSRGELAVPVGIGPCFAAIYDFASRASTSRHNAPSACTNGARGA